MEKEIINSAKTDLKTVDMSTDEKQDSGIREKVDKILDMDINIIQKAELILIVLGLKPATEISLGNDEESLQDAEETLKQIGLKCKEKIYPHLVNHIEEFIRNKYLHSIVVARDEQTVEKLFALDAGSKLQDQIEYGRLMGFPETAIKAFIENECADNTFMQKYLQDNGLIFCFRFSKENFLQEIETVKKWSEAIKFYAPNLYAEILEEYIKIKDKI